jgi:hypothetical protein
MNYHDSYVAHLDKTNVKLKSNPNFIPEPFLFDAQLAYTVVTSEWRVLKSIKDRIGRYADAADLDKYTIRLEELAKAHALELQVFFKLNVVHSTLGLIPAYPIDRDFNALLKEAYMAGLKDESHELGTLGNVSSYRDVTEATMPIGSIVTLAVSEINSLSKKFDVHVWEASDNEEAELDTILLDELFNELRHWCSLAVLSPKDYPALGHAVMSETLPAAIGHKVMDYLGNVPEVYLATFGDAVAMLAGTPTDRMN